MGEPVFRVSESANPACQISAFTSRRNPDEGGSVFGIQLSAFPSPIHLDHAMIRIGLGTIPFPSNTDRFPANTDRCLTDTGIFAISIDWFSIHIGQFPT